MRVYAPQIGKWIQRDPSGEGSDVNLTRYCNGDPINGRDPSGEYRLTITPKGGVMTGTVNFLFYAKARWEFTLSTVGTESPANGIIVQHITFESATFSDKARTHPLGKPQKRDEWWEVGVVENNVIKTASGKTLVDDQFSFQLDIDTKDNGKGCFGYYKETGTLQFFGVNLQSAGLLKPGDADYPAGKVGTWYYSSTKLKDTFYGDNSTVRSNVATHWLEISWDSTTDPETDDATSGS